MNIILPNYKGGVLKTAGKYHSEDITITSGLTKYAGEYEDIKTSFTVTLEGKDTLYNRANASYSIDCGMNWTSISSSPIVIENVNTIMFKSTSVSYHLNVRTTDGINVFLHTVTNEASDNIKISEDTTYYLYGISESGGATD